MAISNEHRELFSRIIPVELQPVPCRQCVFHPSVRVVEHAETCPVRVEFERVTDGDRQWFENHPNADFYYRPFSWTEAVESVIVWTDSFDLPSAPRLAPIGRVRVNQIRPGVRYRDLRGTGFEAKGT